MQCICVQFVSLVYCFSVFEKGVNNAGRGVNVAVFAVDTMKIVKAVRFDTYQSSDGWLFVLLYLTDCHKHIASTFSTS